MAKRLLTILIPKLRRTCMAIFALSRNRAKIPRSEYGFLEEEFNPNSTRRVDRPGVRFYEVKTALYSVQYHVQLLLWAMEAMPSGDMYWTNARVGSRLHRLYERAKHALELDGYLERHSADI